MNFRINRGVKLRKIVAKKGLSVSEIADMLEESEETNEKIVKSLKM